MMPLPRKHHHQDEHETRRESEHGINIVLLLDSDAVLLVVVAGLNAAFKRDGWLRGMIDTGWQQTVDSFRMVVGVANSIWG